MLSSIEKNQLKAVGLEIRGKLLKIYEQGKLTEIGTVKLSELKKIYLCKSYKKDYRKTDLLNLLKSEFYPSHKSHSNQAYSLTFELGKHQKISTEISGFDLIVISSIIRKINGLL
jgi:hypothetical protein